MFVDVTFILENDLWNEIETLCEINQEVVIHTKLFLAL